MAHSNRSRQEQFLQYLLAEYNYPFSGWDFSYLRGRMVEETALPWDYTASVVAALPKSSTLLDMGTGGGEFLSALSPLPAETHATEAYAPNIVLARQRLEPLGITVHAIDDDAHLPVEDDYFDLVINRHEAYVPQELLRIMRIGGTFITQQVGGRNDLDLNKALGDTTDFGLIHWDCAYAVAELERAGMHVVEQQEVFTETRFYDIGAVVYYLKAVPWQIADFTVEHYLVPLLRLHAQIQRDGYFAVRNHRFFIVAQKV